MTIALKPGEDSWKSSSSIKAPTSAGRAEAEMHKRSKLLAFTAVAQFAMFSFSIFSSAAVARGLSLGERGALNLVVALATSAQVLGHFSVEQSQTYQWSKGIPHSVLASNAVMLGMLNGTLAASVTWLLVRVIAPQWFGTVSAVNLFVGLAAVPLIVTTLYITQLARLSDRLNAVNRSRVITTFGYTLFVGGLYLTDQLTVVRALAGWAVSSFMPGIIMLRGFEVRLRNVDTKIAWQTLTKGLAYHPAMASIFLLWRIDQLLVNAYFKVDKAPLALYAQAATLSEMALLVTTSIAQVMLPKQVEGSLSDATRFSAVVVRVNLLFSALVAIGLAIVGPFAMVLVYGRAYAGSTAPLLALLPGVVAVAVLSPCQAILVRMNKPSRITAIYLPALALNVVLNKLFLPHFGITGTALASTIPYILLSGFLIRWISHEVKVPMREFFPGKADAQLLLRVALRRKQTVH